MKDLFADLDRWRAAGRAVAVARVVGVEGSGPREPGAAMAVSDDGEVAGSVSGGCVEGAVVTEALDVLDTGERRVVSFGYSDAEGIAVGLTCGGTVHLFVEPLEIDDVHDALRAALAAHEPVSLATVIRGPGAGRKLLVGPDRAPVGGLGHPELDRVVTRDALGELDAGRSDIRHYGARGEPMEEVVDVFVESFAAAPRMLIFGAVDFTAALATAAGFLGFRVTVCDAREVFATPQRFPMADEVVVDWPHRLVEREAASLGRADAVCVLTHDAKFDVPAILAALATDVGYLGVMGSRRTHADRVERLRQAGVTDEQLDRLMAPIGLDIGARTPEETAVSVCAEIIACRTGHRAGSLRTTDGPIH